MDTGTHVVDALELARNRLHEPNVRAAYEHLVKLVDHHLGEKLIQGREGGMLTEPQLVLISYGLRHVQGAQAMSMTRAASRLIAALTGDDTPQRVPVVTPPAEPPQPPAAYSITQNVGVMNGGTVIMTGHQSNNGNPPGAALPTPPPDAPEPEEPEALVQTVSDVFLSYAHRDGATMRRLRQDLRSHGLTVWTDENLRPGTESWKNAVESAIRGGRTFVVLMTPDSKKSQWVEREVNVAQLRRIPIFPVLCRGDSKNAVPLALNGYQFADMRKESQYRDAMMRLVSAIKARLRT